MAEAAVGNRALLGRAIEKINLGIPRGSFYDFLRFDSMELARFAAENRSQAITGSEGMDKGTPGTIGFKGSYKYDLTASRVLYDLVMMTGEPLSITVLTAATAWLVKIRPRRQGTATGYNDPRAGTFYIHEGGEYAGSYQFGRRCSDITLADTANQRVKVTAEYPAPTGETISTYAVAKTGNAGTYTGKLAARGRRDPFSADKLKSLFLNVTAEAGGVVTFAAQLATSGDGLGAGFPVGAYNAATFNVSIPSTATGHDGWTTVVLDAGLLGLFGENNEPYEITLGSATTGIAVGDKFEIQPALGVLATTSTTESRLSSFHLLRKIGATADEIDVRFDSGTIKLARPYDPYYVNGRRLPLSVDPTGDVGATVQFKKRIFDRRFREYNEAVTRFSVHDKYMVGNIIDGTTVDHETVEFWMPQCAVQALDSGDVSSKELLEESVTLVAEQPSGVEITAPAGFDSGYSWQCNIVTSVSPMDFQA